MNGSTGLPSPRLEKENKLNDARLKLVGEDEGQGVSARSVADLVDGGFLAKATPELNAVAAQFSVAVTPAMLSLIDPHDPSDPIAAQFVPSEKELQIRAEELRDPIGDKTHQTVEGIVHRYPDRVLFKLLHSCPVYCRFCFRREQVGQGGGVLSREAIDKAIDYIRDHKEIWEVIFSGGDPLMLSDRRLGEIVARLNDIPHVKILRIHTRYPVVEPERITQNLIKALKGRVPVYILLHCNHARELTDAARAACARLVDAGFPMLSQSVLLRGINDTAESLQALMRAFVEARVKPHYLHHTDLAKGTGHFRVPIAEGQKLLRAMRGTMSGLCIPTYMLEIPEGHGKVPLDPVFAVDNGDGWLLEDFRGHRHVYREE